MVGMGKLKLNEAQQAVDKYLILQGLKPDEDAEGCEEFWLVNYRDGLLTKENPYGLHMVVYYHKDGEWWEDGRAYLSEDRSTKLKEIWDFLRRLPGRKTVVKKETAPRG